MEHVVKFATLFLLAGTVYSDLPYPKVNEIREKNRRLGLGLMGIHEWLVQRGYRYEVSEELRNLLRVYETSGEIANAYADSFGLSRPEKTRAVAPTGTIGIMAETTTGAEPILSAAYKRRYLKGTSWHYQYVIDPTAKKLVEVFGINPDNIEDAYSLTESLEGIERRVRFQAELQEYVDHAISSTINLPPWGGTVNNEDLIRPFGTMLLHYLPRLRGITVYPDGARGGQPLTPVSYSVAKRHYGKTFSDEGKSLASGTPVETLDVCDITKGGSCGT
jgi:ribonucleoside-diphosphate reductase alpha chain